VVVVALGVVGPARWGSAVEGVKLAAETGKLAQFGNSIDIRGDLAVVGAPNDDVGGARAGAAYVFRRLEERLWTQTAKLAASDGSVGERFGERVATDGDTIVVWAEYGSTAEGVTGAVYVFSRVPGEADTWQEVVKLAPSVIGSTASFGYGLAVEGDVVVASALELIESEYVGAVYIFGRDEGGEDRWGQVTRLVPAAPERSFGFALSLSGDTLFVGARDSDDVGDVHVHERNQGGPDQWGWVMTLARPDSVDPYSKFGDSLALDGDTAVIGARGVNMGEGNVGAIYLFAREPGEPASWSLVTEKLGDETLLLGELVDLSGDAVIAWLWEDGPCEFEGECHTVRLYSRDHGGPDQWGLVTRIWPWDGADWFTFGTGLAIDGTAVFVGAPKAEPLPGPGSVYVYVCGDGSSEGDLCSGLGIGAPSLTASGRAALVASLALAAVLLTGRARAKRRS
jgi:hypothetical protein